MGLHAMVTWQVVMWGLPWQERLELLMHRTEHHALHRIVRDDDPRVYAWFVVFDAAEHLHKWDGLEGEVAVCSNRILWIKTQCSPFIKWGKEHTGEQVRQFEAPMKSDDDFLLCIARRIVTHNEPVRVRETTAPFKTRAMNCCTISGCFSLSRRNMSVQKALLLDSDWGECWVL